MVPVEAQACGAPIIALGVGGATETVVDGRTGRLVPTGGRDPVDAFCQVMAEHDPAHYRPSTIRANAERFSIQRFCHRFERLLAEQVPDWRPGPSRIEEGVA